MLPYFKLLPFSITIIILSISSYAQPKQDVLKDSIDWYNEKEDFAKVVTFAREWGDKIKGAKGSANAEYSKALSTVGTALSKSGKNDEAAPILK